MNLQRVFGCRTLLLAALLCAGTAPALAQPDPSPAAPRPRETVRGADLLTEAERADICARLRSATSAQERQAIMQRTHVVQLPPGRYRVVASADGKEREQTLVVPAKGGVSSTMRWTPAS
ncbi:hypothetical protein PO002_36795 [Cupriavidus necator]|uniref:hypothetical protein n=1 Tax=Cupriavidus necator TaxID=106590 RepID=UPI0039C2F759